jgi:hypothetical protein
VNPDKLGEILSGDALSCACFFNAVSYYRFF